MSDKAYIANYNSALSFLKLNQKEPALEALKRALSQVPEDEVNENNAVYLSILSGLSFILLENREVEEAYNLVNQGLAVKKNHADLLFIRALLLMDLKRFDEMLEVIIHYLLALGETEGEKYDYRFTSEQALKEIYETLVPMAYRYSLQYGEIRDIVERLCRTTNNEWLKKAYDIMVAIDNVRSSGEN